MAVSTETIKELAKQEMDLSKIPGGLGDYITRWYMPSDYRYIDSVGKLCGDSNEGEKYKILYIDGMMPYGNLGPRDNPGPKWIQVMKNPKDNLYDPIDSKIGIRGTPNRMIYSGDAYVLRASEFGKMFKNSIDIWAVNNPDDALEEIVKKKPNIVMVSVELPDFTRSAQDIEKTLKQKIDTRYPTAALLEYVNRLNRKRSGDYTLPVLVKPPFNHPTEMNISAGIPYFGVTKGINAVNIGEMVLLVISKYNTEIENRKEKRKPQVQPSNSLQYAST